MTKNHGTKSKSDADEPSLSLSQIIEWQDNLKKDIDFTKPEDELTPEEVVKRAIYNSIDGVVEDNVGTDTKKKLDDARKEMEDVTLFQKNLNKLSEIGKEIEKNFIWQGAYLINHFDKKNPENHFHLVVSGMGNDLVNKEMPNSDRVDFAKKLLEIVGVYRKKVVSELTTKHEIIHALLPTFESTLKQMDFGFYIAKTHDEEVANEMSSKFNEWLTLSKELLKYRTKATEAICENLDMEVIIPNHVIENLGDITKNLSAIGMNAKGERMIKLLGEADKGEKEVEAKRAPISEWLYGKTESYMEFPKDSDENQVASNPVMTINPLQDKAWFRLAKVIYIGAYAVALMIGAFVLTEDSTIGFWLLVGAVIIFTVIKKSFYYVSLGKTSWQ